MIRVRIIAFLLLVAGFFIGWFVYNAQVNPEARFPFQLGLDLSGGSSLTYRADISAVTSGDADVKDAMESLRDVIERRVNLFGVGEPNVQTESTKLAGAGEEQRLIVELPGITDIDEAVAMIGQTPELAFKTERDPLEREKLIAEFKKQTAAMKVGTDDVEDIKINVSIPEGFAVGDLDYINTELTGRYLSRATLEFSQGVQSGGSGFAGEPIVVIKFNKEGAQLFQEMTAANVGKTIAIYLDGSPISAPVVNEAIAGGEAVISGNFTPEEAKQLVRRLNSGALPVPIELISTQTIGPSLGADAANAGVKAGVLGLLLVAVFITLWYRLPGFLASIALVIYGIVMLALFQLIPVTLTSAGIAGFVISLGIAVDANILIFERMKEEMRAGRTIRDAVRDGFKRAWPSIRDANITSIISAVILFWFGSSLIKGFALTFGLGVLVSMITAISVTRAFAEGVTGYSNNPIIRWLYGTGVLIGKKSSIANEHNLKS